MLSNKRGQLPLYTNGNLPDFLANVSDEQSDLWIHQFFLHFNLLFPVLSRPYFDCQLQQQDQLDPLVKYAVYAIGCRYADSTESTDRLLFDHCEYLLNTSQDPPTLATVQALIIMCWYTYLTADMHKCYSLFHRLESSIHFLGLGYESDQFDITQAEMRRRAFWVAQVMDQWLSSCTGGGHRLIQSDTQKKKWDCRWPQLEDNQLSALQMNSFKEMIRLSHIVGDMCDGISTARLEASLTEWLLHLPCYLDYGKPSHDPSPLAKVYRILYYTVQIMLSYRQHNQGLSISICTTAANTIIHIAEQMLEQQQGTFLYNIFFLSVTLATSIHLESAISTDTHCLHRSIAILKEINCTLLSPAYFNKVVDHFLTERCFIQLEPALPLNSSRSLKRPLSPPDRKEYQLTLNQQQQQQIRPNKWEQQQQQQQQHQQQQTYDLLDTPLSSFDLNDILLTETTFPPNLMDSSSPWFDFFEPFDPNPDSSCSSISLFTPSQSPTLSLDCQKELDVLSSPSFFSSFV
ncbi:hypothetical protein K501DRAFT_262641 [Backusella circina FSU 941]|nr:hypothetical protein K501DRAFT_262641 [Backusella circina FSU 941]